MGRHHILYLIDTLASTLGGAEGILLKITQMLPAERFACSVATFSPDPEIVPRALFPCPVHLIPLRRMYDWRGFRAAFRLAHLLRIGHISILHTFFPASDLLGSVVGRLSGCPILISSRRDMGLMRSRAHRAAYRLTSGLFDQVQAVADEVRAYHIEQDKLDPARVVTVHNGVDLGAIDAAPALPWAEGSGLRNRPVVICVANIRAVKAFDVFVRAAAIVHRVAPQVQFVVAGANQDRRHFERMTDIARETGAMEALHLLGSRGDVPSLLKASTLFFLCSRSEGLSNSILEAMACRLPCVATRVGGNSELIEHGGSGYLVPPEDPEAAAACILEVLGDPALAARLGERGRALVEAKFSLTAMMSRLTGLYEELLAGAGLSRCGRDTARAESAALKIDGVMP